MPDIAMCQDDDCPARSKCYRHSASGTTPKGLNQAYLIFCREHGDKNCGYFWPLPAPAEQQNGG